MNKEFFPQRPEATPTIYAYELPNDISRKGQLKVGDTNRTAREHISCVASLLGLRHIVAKSRHNVSYADTLSAIQKIFFLMYDEDRLSKKGNKFDFF